MTKTLTLILSVPDDLTLADALTHFATTLRPGDTNGVGCDTINGVDTYDFGFDIEEALLLRGAGQSAEERERCHA
jgi:hypothetical protein